MTSNGFRYIMQCVTENHQDLSKNKRPADCFCQLGIRAPLSKILLLGDILF